MATENYGVYAKLLDSIATTPVDTSTNIVFVGAAHIDHAMTGMKKISSMSRF